MVFIGSIERVFADLLCYFTSTSFDDEDEDEDDDKSSSTRHEKGVLRKCPDDSTAYGTSQPNLVTDGSQIKI